MANYKLTTAEPASLTSFLAFTASASDTIITSVVASDNATSTLEALIQKSGGNIIEVAHAQVQADKPEELLTAPIALEAGDKLYVRTSKAGAKFVISYVEDTTIPNDTALGGLADVSTSGVTDGQSLVYSTSSSQWEPSTITGGGGGGASALDDLSDVDITSSTTGDVLRYDGTNYVDTPLNTWIDARVATLDADDIDDSSTTHKYATQGQLDKVNHISVTQAVDLDTIESNVNTNNGKTGYSDALVSANTNVQANTAKISYPTADSDKLALIEAAATANSTDAYLLNLANSTGSITSGEVSDFEAETITIIDDQIGGTDDVSEGNNNLYYTEARVSANTNVNANSAKVGYTDAAVDARIGVAKIEDLDEVSSVAPSTGQVLKWSGTEWAPAADNSSTGGAGGVVDSVNGISQAAVVLDADDISDATTTNKFTTAAEASKLSLIEAEATANDTDANLLNRGNHSGQQLAATISDFGTQATTNAVAVIAASDLQDIGNVSTPTTGEFLKWDGTNWVTAVASGGSGGVVDSVNGISQATVVLDADDIDDASTTHKFVTAGDVTKLGHISVANAVNLDVVALSASTAFIASNSNTAGVAAITNSIHAHNDVSFSQANPQNLSTGRFLRWNLGNLKWEDELISLQDLENVSTPTTGQFLKWDGTNWVTSAVSATGGDNLSNHDLTMGADQTFDTDGNIMTFDVNGGEIVFTDSAGGDTYIQTGQGEVLIQGITYPDADGTNGQVLTTNGSGSLSFTTVSGGGGGGLGAGDQTLTADRLIDTNGFDLSVELDSSTNDVFSVSDGTHDLFEVNTDTSGTLFSVNDVSGLPVFEAVDNGTMVLPKILTAAPTGTPKEGTMQLAIVSGTCYLYVYINAAWKKTTLT